MRRPSAGWVPAGLVVVAAVVVLCRFGVPVAEVAAFAGHVGVGVMVPGVLLWRALGPGGGSLPVDLAAGLALGYAVEVLVYIAARAAGVPLAVVAWPVVTIGAFVVVPRLRRHWRGGGVRVPVGWAWAMSAVVGYLLVWSAQQFYRVHGLAWPGNAAPYVDMSYHLALLGEIKHHVPPTFPMVLGERLSYHWFVYAEMAATSWVTGIEPQTLLYRLTALPMLAGLAVLVAAVEVRQSVRDLVRRHPAEQGRTQTAHAEHDLEDHQRDPHHAAEKRGQDRGEDRDQRHQDQNVQRQIVHGWSPRVDGRPPPGRLTPAG